MVYISLLLAIIFSDQMSPTRMGKYIVNILPAAT